MVTAACLCPPPPFLQVVEDGYEFFAKRQLVTLFSAPNYCGEFDNAGGMMSVDETLMCSFQVQQNSFPESLCRGGPCVRRAVTERFRLCADPEALREESKVSVRRDEHGAARHSPAHSPGSKEAMRGGGRPRALRFGFSLHTEPEDGQKAGFFSLTPFDSAVRLFCIYVTFLKTKY